MSSNNKRPKRNPKRAAKDPWAEDKLMTSTSSNLIYLDLVKLLANPEAWNCLEESEKREILDLLPEDLHPNPDPSPDDPDAKIPPLPEEFLRYSNNWRDGIRHFQLDLQNGRYDPVWLREAGQAMQQRADGKFDKFKEEEFEQFWGQKQKMDKTLVAGQSRQVRLSTLINNGIVLVGDVWKYSRAFKSKDNLLVEKEARIVDIQNGQLTFELPPGQRVFLPAPQTLPLKGSHALVMGEIEKPGVVTTTTAEIEQVRTAETSAGTHSDTNPTEEAGSFNKRKSEIKMESRKRGRGRKPQVQTSKDLEVDQVKASTKITRPTQVTVEITNPPPTEANVTTSVMTQTTTTERDGHNLELVSEQPSATVEDAAPQLPIVEGTSEEPGMITVSGITGPSAIATKILEADGRAGKVPHGNAWKEFRAYRNNQDMGSLWEVRQAWFLRNNSLAN
ncbi:Asx homology domain-containing protein [Aspergillus pseudotamarii]|uniref:Asx homology domain-containing protein n=1 Tax=Aspergillus pseudotamarii TaxID=132259 RepID=A0A5N6T7C8_ASPPS|nr:ASXH domain-containing protein [Aspergillus pseudotamarii]KAE8142170.1 Asx homology domain-containing protein [Aspergillus pseudotamarii]